MFTNAQRQRVASRLAQFDFKTLFYEELGWDAPPRGLRPAIHTLDEHTYTFTRISHKRDFYVFLCTSDDGHLPLANVRSKLETWLGKRSREHITIYVDSAHTEQVWVWVKREPGRPIRRFSHRYTTGQTGESLLQKLSQLEIAFEEEDDLTLVDVTSRVRAAFNVERATKKFYDRFKKERGAFENFVQGIPNVDMSKWYVSVMLNRLMFVYFIQRKGFLDGDPHYLRNRLHQMQQQFGDNKFYSFYRTFLLRLFHEGLGDPGLEPELEALIGKVPYLNGGIFQLHEVEQTYPDIQISDAAFENIFDFFDQYQWHLDDRPLHDDSEINPDVLGYIFEKYINQKQMGAYYTKEDITEYISKNTIIPFLFDQAVPDLTGFQNLSGLWQNDPDRYIYPAVRHGADKPVPDEIAVGLDDVSQRGLWNTRTPEPYALPTEIWRETVARRRRYEDVTAKLENGDIRTINDFITYNLDIQQLAQVGTVDQIEPLPDIDFNIRAGNTLVGFTSKEEMAQAMQSTQAGQGRMMFGEDQAALTRIEEQAADVDRLFSRFRAMQTSGDLSSFDAADFVTTKQALQDRLHKLEEELNRHLATQYGINPQNSKAYEKWRDKHQPFHWFIEFYGILTQGGFDVVIGNPPYVIYRNIKKDYSLLNYRTESCGNLYAFISERSTEILQSIGRLGFVIPVASVCTDGFEPLRDLLQENGEIVISNYNDRLGKLFDGLEHNTLFFTN